MKRLLAVLLILSVLLSSAALAAEREIDFYYGYAHLEVTKDGSPVMYVIYFSEDYTCYFLVQAFHKDKPGLGRSYVGHWSYTADGDVFAKTGENTDITFKISSLGSIVDRSTMQVYEPFDALID